MIQCKDCEFFTRDEQTGRIFLRCDPFSTVKEPGCLQKWQLIRLDGLLHAYQSTLRWYQKLAPMQEKMFEMMKREIDEMDEADSWKTHLDNEQDEDEDEDNIPGPDEGFGRPYR